jgi:hypothetical protein
VAFPASQIMSVARYAFRNHRFDEQEERIAETVAWSWAFFVRARRRGKDPSKFPTVVAKFAVKYVRSGRHLGQSHNSKKLYTAHCAARAPENSGSSGYGDRISTIGRKISLFWSVIVQGLTNPRVSELPMTRAPEAIDRGSWSFLTAGIAPGGPGGRYDPPFAD